MINIYNSDNKVSAYFNEFPNKVVQSTVGMYYRSMFFIFVLNLLNEKYLVTNFDMFILHIFQQK